MSKPIPGWGEIPLFKLCREDPYCVELFKESGSAKPVRIYPFLQAPKKPVTPYAVWQVLSGEPEQYLAHAPDVDNWLVQVDVYADTAALCREGAQSIIAAIETGAYVDYGPTSKEAETNRFRINFTASFITCRKQRA